MRILPCNALQHHASLSAIAAAVSRQAAALAFADAFYALAAITLLFTPLVFLLRSPRGSAGKTAVALD